MPGVYNIDEILQSAIELVVRNEAEAFSYFLKGHPNFTRYVHPEKKQTFLHLAAQNNSSDIIDSLKRAVPKESKKDWRNYLNQKDSYKQTALRCAVRQGHFEVVKALVDAGANINETEMDEDGWSLLHLATSKRHNTVVAFLMGRGLSPTLVDCKNQTPVTFAFLDGNIETLRVLLELGSLEPDKKVLGDALLWFSKHDLLNQEILSKLREIGFDPDDEAMDRYESGDSLLNSLCERNPKNSREDAANLKAIRFVLSLGANPNFRNKGFVSPIHYAAENSIAALKELINFGAIATLQDVDSWNALDHAAYAGNLATFRYLLTGYDDHGQRYIFSSEDIKNAFDKAIEYDRIRFMRELLTDYYGRPSPATILAVCPKRKHNAFAPEQTSIAITFRNDGNGYGPLFDHHALQQSTDRETVIFHPCSDKVTKLDAYVMENASSFLQYGFDLMPGKRTLKTVSDLSEDIGLLVIPGRPRNQTNAAPSEVEERQDYELDAINRAKRTGRPILAICGGAWRLWEAFGGKTMSVSSHSARRMIGINDEGKITFNIQLHGVELTENSIVRAAMLGKSGPPSELLVNSVHWQAVNPETTPADLVITAKSVQTSPTQKAQPGTPEAFETAHGAPMLGMQWHPEAYFGGQNKPSAPYHLRLLNWAAQAGDTYCMRQKLVREFEEKIDSLYKSRIAQARNSGFSEHVKWIHEQRQSDSLTHFFLPADAARHGSQERSVNGDGTSFRRG